MLKLNLTILVSKHKLTGRYKIVIKIIVFCSSASFEDIRVEGLEIFLAVLLVFLGISASFGNLVSLYIFGSMGNRRNGGYITRFV